MAEVAVHAPGTPIWVDLSTPDPSAASAFYAKLFSWTRTEPSAEAGGYAMFQLEGRIIAGVGPQQQAGAPPFWMTYVSTEDAAATAARVEASGGKTIAPPMEVLGEGSMAVFSDPSGAVFGVWQPARFKGAEIYNQPGAYTWSELQVRGIDAAKPLRRRSRLGRARQPGRGSLHGVDAERPEHRGRYGHERHPRLPVERAAELACLLLGRHPAPPAWPRPGRRAVRSWSSHAIPPRDRLRCSAIPRAPSSPSFPRRRAEPSGRSRRGLGGPRPPNLSGPYREATAATSFQADSKAAMFSQPSTSRVLVARYTVVRLMPASAMRRATLPRMPGSSSMCSTMTSASRVTL